MIDNKDQEFKLELRAELEQADFGHSSCEQAFEDGAQWGREYGRNEKQLEFENLEGSLCPEDFGFDEYIRHLRTKVDRLEAENSKLRAALDKISSGAVCSACSCSCHDVARKALGGEE